jgi:hypothetical protein
MNEINHFKVLYYSRLCDRWCSADLIIDEWYDSWWCGYIACQKELVVVSHRNISIVDFRL